MQHPDLLKHRHIWTYYSSTLGPDYIHSNPTHPTLTGAFGLQIRRHTQALHPKGAVQRKNVAQSQDASQTPRDVFRQLGQDASFSPFSLPQLGRALGTFSLSLNGNT